MLNFYNFLTISYFSHKVICAKFDLTTKFFYYNIFSEQKLNIRYPSNISSCLILNKLSKKRGTYKLIILPCYLPKFGQLLMKKFLPLIFHFFILSKRLATVKFSDIYFRKFTENFTKLALDMIKDYIIYILYFITRNYQHVEKFLEPYYYKWNYGGKSISKARKEYFFEYIEDVALKRPAFFNLGLKSRFEITSKWTIQTKYLFIIPVIDKILRDTYKYSNIEYQGKDINSIKTLNNFPKLIYLLQLLPRIRGIIGIGLDRKSNSINPNSKIFNYQRSIEIILFSKIYYNQLNFKLLAGVGIIEIFKEIGQYLVPFTNYCLNDYNTFSFYCNNIIPNFISRIRISLFPSPRPLPLFGGGSKEREVDKYRDLKRFYVLGAYSSRFLKNHFKLKVLLQTPKKLYSTKTSIIKSSKSITSSRSSTKTKRLFSPKINYIKGWRSNWLRKFRYMEMLAKYKLDANDKLFLRILKERKYNLDKKMYQSLGFQGEVGFENNSLKSNSESLINNRNLSLIKNKKNTIPTHTQKKTKIHSKYSALGKASDLLTNQFIQYKFNRSKAKSNSFHPYIFWKGSYLSKHSPNAQEIISTFPYIFNLWDWGRKEDISSSMQEIVLKTKKIYKVSKFKYLSLFHILYFTNLFVNNYRFKLAQSLKFEKVLSPRTKSSQVGYKLDENKNLSKIVEFIWCFWKEERKIKRELDKLSNIRWGDESLSQESVLNEVSFISPNLKDKGIRPSNRWFSCEDIDIISLENLLKSFFKKMYSLISLPILEYLPDKWNIRLFYYLKKNAKTYYSSTNIINSNLRSILGLNFRLPQINTFSGTQDRCVTNKPVEGFKKGYRPVILSDNLKDDIEDLRKEGVYGKFKVTPLSNKAVTYFTEEISKNSNLINLTDVVNGGVFGDVPISSKFNDSYNSTGILDKTIGDFKSNNLDYHTRKGNINYALRLNLSKPRLFQLDGEGSEKKQYLNILNTEELTWKLNKISTSKSRRNLRLLDELVKSQSRSRSMQILSLKNNWTNIINWSVLARYNKTNLTKIDNIKDGYYISNINALIRNSNSLKLNLFSKWRGENGVTEYQKKLNRKTRFLQDEMTIKEAILFSNPLLKEILVSQSLIYPYSLKNNHINERLALFNKKKDNKMTYFNEAVLSQKARIEASAPTSIGLGLSSALNFKLIHPWQSIVPIKLNTLKKDYYKKGVLIKNSLLKHIFNKNLAKLNFILFLDRLKEFKSIITKPTFNKFYRKTLKYSEFSLPLSYLNKLDKKSILQSNLELKIYKYRKILDNSFSVYNTYLTLAKFYTEMIKSLPLNLPILHINNSLRLKEVNTEIKTLDVNNFNTNQRFILTDNLPSLWVSDTEIKRSSLTNVNFASVNRYLESIWLDRYGKVRNINTLKISATKNIYKFAANSLNYNPYNMNNNKDNRSLKANLLVNSSINLGESCLEEDRKIVPNITSLNLNLFDKGTVPYHSQAVYNNSLKDKVKNTKNLLGLRDINKDIMKLVESLGINIFTTSYRKIDREIDSPNNKKSKGLISYNKILFKKLLVFLKLIFNKEIELDLTRIKNPYNETHILNQILGEVIKYKSSSFYRLTQIIRANANIKPKFISDLADAQFSKHYLISSTLLSTNYPLNNLVLIKEKEKTRSNTDISTLITPEIDKITLSPLAKNISSYNIIALDKWSNLKQYNKQKKIHKKIGLDLKRIELNNQFFNEANIQMDKDILHPTKDNYMDIMRDRFTEKKGKPQKQEIITTNWRNLRNNFSICFYKIKEINLELEKIKLAKAITNKTTKQKTEFIYTHFSNISPSILSSNLTIDSKLEWKKINKNITDNLHTNLPLIRSKKKVFDLSPSDEGLSISLKTNNKTNHLNKEFYSMLKDRKIFSSTSSPITQSINMPTTNHNRLANTTKVSLVNSNISGIKLKLGGRLEKTTIIPRKSSQEILIGNISRGSTSFKNTSRLTYKNKRGAYSITVSSSYLSNYNPFTSRLKTINLNDKNEKG